MNNNKYICIHGHFYQPPRENPWLEEVELQESASPYHDWNCKITAEAYAPNGASKIIGKDGKVINIVNNYSRISFNFGPTLLSWLKRNRPRIYKCILDADIQSREFFSGHGSAIAQAYNHIIMPLANSKDKKTQIIWGIKDFEYHFKRKSEGMWLPETAVDYETLDIMAEQGIKFTILAPSQAKMVRKIGEVRWEDVSGLKINSKRPYICNLPSGKNIGIFFYDGPISQDIAFNSLLNNGENFANRLLQAFSEEDKTSQIVNIATDGETYGHHHKFGDMALAYCIYYIQSNKLARITNYGEYLEKNPPEYEVKIFENSSWSCIHGIERWRDDCGCSTGMHKNWNQKWRAPLRKAMDWLREKAIEIYEAEMLQHVDDYWKARDNYIEIILNRSRETVENFFSRFSTVNLSYKDKVTVLKLLEIQRNSMLMYTSCGWFFDDISGIESRQVMQYAKRVIQLAEEVSGSDLEPEYMKILAKAPSNIPEYGNGSNIYEKLIKSTVINLLSVGAHYALSSLFEDYPEVTKIYCYEAERLNYEKTNLGKCSLATGIVNLKSDITWEEKMVSFSVAHLGDHSLIGGVKWHKGSEPFETISQKIKRSFLENNISEVILLMDKYFGTHSYSLKHLFKDKRREVMNKITSPATNKTKS